MVEKKKISVIVPVYNAESYLERCLDSIISQTLREIEIICVDDGSTDGSPDILKQYQGRDSRIIVITQPNSGTGAARNTGLFQASGEYIIFWDSDDFFEQTALEQLYEKSKADDSDICICGYMNYWEESDKVYQYEVHPKTSKIPDLLPFNIRSCPDHILNFGFGVVWNKLFRLDFLKEKELKFPEHTPDEDVYFTDQTLCMAERITVVDKPLIYYCDINPNSLSKTYYGGVGLRTIDVWLQIKEILKANDVYPKQSFANQAFNSMLWHIRWVRFSWEAYEQFYYMLRDTCLKKLDIIPNEPGYIHSPKTEELLSHWLNESAEEFLLTYIVFLDMKDRENQASKYAIRQKNEEKITKLKEKHDKTEASLTKKLGDLQEKLEKLKSKNSKLSEKNEILLTKNQKLSEKNEELTLRIEELKNKNKDLSDLNKKQKRTIISLKTSKSYKIGRAVTWLPRKVKRLLKKIM